MKTFSGRAGASAISLWEIAMLASKGRLSLKPKVGLGPDFYGDPAVRMMVATALVLGLSLIRADRDMIAWNKKQAVI